ncbi:hypothetical protein T439DRAFT_329578 [Meredithblackwellia eburnea MCA 4105]
MNRLASTSTTFSNFASNASKSVTKRPKLRSKHLITTNTISQKRQLRLEPLTLEHRHPAFKVLSYELDPLPAFRTNGKDVKVLKEPQQFYRRLLDKIRRAKRRIFIASLYVGKEEHELITTLHSTLASNPFLKCTILLDYLRSTREHPSPTSASLVASLAARFPEQVEVRLYHTTELKGWKRKWVPKRFNEGWGLMHMKVYGVDDDVLISGANLSQDYFTNRQDRYVEFLSHGPLSDYFSSLVSTVSSYAFLATATDTATSHPTINISWPSTNSSPNPFISPATTVPTLISSAQSDINSLTRRWAIKHPNALSSSSRLSNEKLDTLLRPTLQMGPFNIRQETDLVVPAIFRAGNALATAPGGRRTRIDWTSGYFNAREGIRENVLKSRAEVRIVSAAPEANGFLNSRGVSKYIPPAYTFLQNEFYDQVLAEGRRRNPRLGEEECEARGHVEMREWKRDGWTYHAKGIWLTPTLSSPIRTPASTSPLAEPHDYDDLLCLAHPLAPYLTLVGSSNYGPRSASRDLEANVLVTTYSPDLRRQLKEEVEHIREQAVDLVNKKLFQRPDRKVPWLVGVAARGIETML